jgi:hypothetical protein
MSMAGVRAVEGEFLGKRCTTVGIGKMIYVECRTLLLLGLRCCVIVESCRIVTKSGKGEYVRRLYTGSESRVQQHTHCGPDSLSKLRLDLEGGLGRTLGTGSAGQGSLSSRRVWERGGLVKVGNVTWSSICRSAKPTWTAKLAVRSL